MNSFNQRKKDVLSKVDKSSKKSWDKKILGLCDKLNASDNYYTTSSCSGRAILIVDQDKKEEGLFRFVSHDLITFEILKKEIEKLNIKEEINFKLVPLIIHVACRSLKDANELNEKAKLSGFKRSGIVSFGKNIVLEINSTEKLEFPLIRNTLKGTSGKILVENDFLKEIVKQTNEKLRKGWKKIKRLEESL